MRLTRLALALLLTGCPASYRYPELIRREASSPTVTVFRDVRVFSAVDTSAVDHQDVRVENGKIVSIAPTGTDLTGARVIEGAGKTLVPGYVDFHVHLTGSPAPPWKVAWPDEPHNLRALLASGVTSAMDVGGELERLKALWKSQAEPSYLGPRFWYSGQIVSLRDGYPTSMVNILFPWPANTVADKRFSGPVSEPLEAVAAVDWRLHNGAHHIKLAIASVPLNAQTMPPELVKATATRAHERGVKAVAHTDTAVHALRAVRAGVDALMHGIHLGALTAAEALELKQAGVVVAPTLVVFDRAEQLYERRFAPTDAEKWLYPADFLEPFSPAGSAGKTLDPQLLEWLAKLKADRADRIAAVKTLYDAGVPLLVGSDASGSIGCLAGGAYLDELRLLSEAGVPNADVLRGATVLPARFIAGPNADFGTIEPGKRADLVLVDGDPLADITATSRIAHVMQGGRLVERVP
ncbi:MAG: amidohydrolase family protein [Myxococcaceae bacterium]|nr:amidohydrolase family protein [Myxococcaceae bacterium]